MTLPPWLQALQSRSPGEEPGDHIARIIRALNGVSLANMPEKLAELFLVNEAPERAKLVSTFKTNCGTSMRCVYCLAGSDHPLITKPYVVGMAVSWLIQAAREKGAFVAPSKWKEAGPGWGMWYGTPGKNDDHVEFCLAVPDPKTGKALHGGGGRAKNAITVQDPSDIRWSWGRPLRGLFDPAKMLA